MRNQKKDQPSVVASYKLRKDDTFVHRHFSEQSPLVVHHFCHSESYALVGHFPPIWAQNYERRWTDFAPYGNTTNASKYTIKALNELYESGNDEG